MARLRLQYVHEFKDRHGVTRRYFRRDGKRTPLPGLPGSDEFMGAYQAALAGRPMPQAIGEDRTAPGTIGAAVAAYYQSAQFVSLSKATQGTYRGLLEALRNAHGEKRLAGLERRHVETMMNEKGDKPAAANNVLRIIRMLAKFAMRMDMLRTDPTAGVKAIRIRSEGFKTWTEADIAKFQEIHPIGSKARLALSLMLYTASRRGDVVRLGPQHVKDRVLTITQNKTGALVEIPIHPDLAEVIAASKSGHLSFLVTSFGKPFSPAGFGNLFRKWCNEAGLTECSAHGLRKAQSRRLAEAGCTPHEIMAITGHKTLKEVTRYTEAANRRELGKSAMGKIRSGNPPVRVAKSGKKINKIK